MELKERKLIPEKRLNIEIELNKDELLYMDCIGKVHKGVVEQIDSNFVYFKSETLP